MADFTIAIAVQISLSAETLAALGLRPAAPEPVAALPANASRGERAVARTERPSGDDTALPPALPATKRGGPHKGWLTPERQALLTALWPTETRARDIRARLKKCAGPALPRPAVIGSTAWRLGLRRPAALQPPQFHKQPSPPPPAPAPEAPDEPATPDPPAETALSSALGEALARRPADPASRGELAPDTTPPVSRVETIRRIAASLPSRTGPAAAPVKEAKPHWGDPKVASHEAIRQWAAERGLLMDAFDLAAVNAKARAIGHPGFVLKTSHT